MGKKCLNLLPRNRGRSGSVRGLMWRSGWVWDQQQQHPVSRQNLLQRVYVSTFVWQNVTANHRVNDAVFTEGDSQVIAGRFMYGPLDMVTLAGEKVAARPRLRTWFVFYVCARWFIKGACVCVCCNCAQVDLHIMTQPPSGEWVYFSTEVTNSSGRVSFNVSDDKRLGIGVYPVKMVVRWLGLYADSFPVLIFLFPHLKLYFVSLLSYACFFIFPVPEVTTRLQTATWPSFHAAQSLSCSASTARSLPACPSWAAIPKCEPELWTSSGIQPLLSHVVFFVDDFLFIQKFTRVLLADTGRI